MAYCCTSISFTRQIVADININDVAWETKGCSGDELTNVCHDDASMNSMWCKIAGKTNDEVMNMVKELPMT